MVPSLRRQNGENTIVNSNVDTSMKSAVVVLQLHDSIFFNTVCVCVCVCVCVRAQPCLTLCDPMDCSPPGSSVHGISQARILEWVAISNSATASNYLR